MRNKRKKIKDSELEGFKYLKAISKLLEKLHDAGCERDTAGNRILHMDQYTMLILLYMFNPICKSLRSLQQVSELKKVQKFFGFHAPRWVVFQKPLRYLTANCSRTLSWNSLKS